MAIALYPFLPESSQKIWTQLGLDGEISNSSWDGISDLGINANHELGEASPLFTKVEEADVEKHKSQLGPSE